MQVAKILGRWTVDGTAVPFADVYEKACFSLFIKMRLVQSSVFIPVFNTLKLRAQEIKEKHNYKFPASVLSNAKTSAAINRLSHEETNEGMMPTNNGVFGLDFSVFGSEEKHTPPTT